MNTLKKQFLATLFIIASLQTFAQYSNMEFVENKGQWESDINFTGRMNNGTFMLQPSGYKVYMVNGDEQKAYQNSFHPHGENEAANAKGIAPQKSYTVHSHVYQVKFLNAAGKPQAVAEKPLNFYNNYFLGDDQSKWASNCKVYQAILYKNMYPGIDVRYYTEKGRLKYDIIVAPGADISKIALQFDGAEGLSVKNKKLNIKTSVGDVTELEPYSYQPGITSRKIVIVDYKLSGNILKFDVKDYDRTQPLIIDPTVVFSTFTGSTVDNWGYTATYDNDGNLYSGGIVFGNGFKTTPGAYQQTFQGGSGSPGEGKNIDIGIMKFNPSGSVALYATYVGGSGDEQPHSLVVDASGNLIISGRTTSANYPATQPLLGPGGGWDIVVTKLNATGSGILGSRRIGGSSDDGVNLAPKYDAFNGTGGTVSIRRNYGDDARSEVILDGAGNVYVASATQSGNFPVSNAFQPLKGAAQDGVLMKFSPDLTGVNFISYLGGNGEDACFVLALNPITNDIYVGGSTTSDNFPGIAPGVISTAFQGNTDGYVSVISNDGSTLQRSSYFGNAGFDMLYGIQFDKLGFPYIMGTSTITWPVINAAFTQANAKQFISKLQPNLSAFVYSMNYGANRSTPNISPIAFLVDRCENVYVSGWGGDVGQGYDRTTTTGMTVTADAFKPTTDGGDFYFFVLEKNAVGQLFASFYGQQGGQFTDHVDGGTSRFDSRGIIYMAMCANCGGDGNFPITPGVAYPNNGSGDRCNLAAVKIAFDLAGIGADVESQINGASTNSGCVPLNVTFTDQFAQGVTYRWDYGDGSAEETTTVPTTNHTYNTVGVYRVRLISTDPASCNITDTSYTTIRARNDEATVGFTTQKLAPCEAFNYQFTNTSVPAAGKPFKATSFTWDFGDGVTQITGNQVVTHSYAAAGTYIVKLTLTDTNYCNAPQEITETIRVAANVKAQFETPPFGCAPYTAVFNNTSLAGQSFFWDFGDGATSTDINPTHLYTVPGVYTVFLRAIDNNTCNVRDSTTKTITVSAKPIASYTYNPNPPQTNTAVVFTNTTLGGTRYKWIFGDGDTLNTIRIDTLVSHIYNETKDFNACLVAYNNFGCTDTACQVISAKITPLVAVPNALTANNDGINDRIYVKGFGISKMTWRIFNRWGKEVFSTANRNEGWDGKYKNVVQPQDVYHYLLEVEFFGGTRQQLKGDITLLR